MGSHIGRMLGLGAAALITASCASRNDVRAGHDAREALLTQIQRTGDQLDVAQTCLEDAITSFETLLQPEQIDMVGHFSQFAEKLEQGKEQLAVFDREVLAMDKSAEKFFAGWRDDFDEFHSEQMRTLSEQRLQTVQQRYERIGETIAPVRERCQQLVLTLEDKRLFLEHDLTPAATAFLRADGATLRTGSGALFGEFEGIDAVAQKFVAAVDTGDRVSPAAAAQNQN